MIYQTLEKWLAYVRYLRQQANQAAADHQQINLVRNRFMAGTATRDEIFLALNTAATQMLIFSQTSTKFSDYIFNSCQTETKEKSTASQQQAPALRQRPGGKDSTTPAPKISPKATAITEGEQPSLWTARSRNDALDRMEASLHRSKQHLDTIFEMLGGEQAIRQQKKTGPTLRLIIGGKGSPEPALKRKPRKRKEANP